MIGSARCITAPKGVPSGLWTSAIASAAFTGAPVSFIATWPGVAGVAVAYDAEVATSFGLMLVVLVFSSACRPPQPWSRAASSSRRSATPSCSTPAISDAFNAATSRHPRPVHRGPEQITHLL